MLKKRKIRQERSINIPDGYMSPSEIKRYLNITQGQLNYIRKILGIKTYQFQGNLRRVFFHPTDIKKIKEKFENIF